MFIFRVIHSIMTNKYVDPLFKKALKLAGHTGYTYPGSCNKYTCESHLLKPKVRLKFTFMLIIFINF